MKKFMMFLFFTCTIFSFTGCASNPEKELNKASKNLTNYTLDIVYNDYKLAVTQNIDYINAEDVELDKLYLHLYPNNFSAGATNSPVSATNKAKAYPNGNSYGKIEISRLCVNDNDSEILLEGNDDDFLKVVLEDALAPDDRVTLTMEYTVTIPNCIHRFGYGDNTINVANFYPVMAVYEDGWIMDPYHYNGDPFYSDMSNYKVKLTAPSSLVLASTGEIKTTQGEGSNTYDITAKSVRDYAFVLSDKFDVISTQYEHTTIYYYYYDDENAERSLQTAVDAIRTFSELFGAYPYSTFSVAKTNFLHGGMEYPNLVYISDDVTNFDDYLNVIVHETAHQWWYGLVGSNAYRVAWLDEGLTDFSTAYFYKYNEGYNISYDEIIKNTNNSYVTFVDVYTNVLGNVDTTMTRALHEYNTEPEYVYITYVKGTLMFDSLLELMGQEKFEKGLSKYFETYKYQNVNADHLIGVFEKVKGCDLQGWFGSWLNGEVVIKSME